MPTLTVFRGLPGSGKSKHARELAAKTGAFVIEPDMFEIIDGQYRYNEKRHRSAFATAGNLARQAMCFSGCDVVFAEVLPKLSDFELLVSCAKGRGYDVRIVTLQISRQESKLRNKHDVRHEDIDRMAAEWEDCPREVVITEKNFAEFVGMLVKEASRNLGMEEDCKGAAVITQGTQETQKTQGESER